MSLADVDSAIDTCEKHLKISEAKGTEIEAFLTVYLLIHICGAFEKEVQKLIVQRAQRANDDELTSFIENTMNTYRGLYISDLKGKLLARFGTGVVTAFDEYVTSEKEIAQSYQNIIVNRHSIAHGKSINISFDELVRCYPESKKVLAKIRTLLGV